jgi:hypothetical protein
MTVKRIVTNIASDRLEGARGFYGAILGLEIVMDFGWIMTFAGEGRSAPQISIASGRDSPARPRGGSCGGIWARE